MLTSAREALSSFCFKYKFRFMGMGFMWAWIYCCWFTSVLFPNSVGISEESFTSWLLSSAGIAITLLSLSFILKNKSIVEIRWLNIVMLICMVVGTFVMADSKVNGIESDVIRNVASFATGVGSGLLWLMWSDFYGMLKVEVTEIVIPLSALMIPVCMIISRYLIEPVSIVFIVVLPIISYVLLLLSLSSKEDIEHIPSTGLRPHFWSEFMRIGIVAVFIHMIVAIVWALLPLSYYQAAGGWIGWPLLVGDIVAALIALMQGIYSRYADIFTMYRWLLPVIAAALAALAIGGIGGQIFASIFISIAQIGYSIVLYVFFSRVAHAGWAGYAISLGFSRGLAQLGILTGNLLSMKIVPAVGAGTVSLPTLCAVLMCAAIVLTLLLLNRESGFKYVLPSASKKVLHLGAQEESSKYPMSQSSTDVLDDEFAANCKQIANDANLTPREKDVFILLAQGRNVPYIRDVLYISKNTTDSHTKSIYRKLDIHSRQELIDLIYGGSKY